jgi:hypothetical protein
MQELPKIVRVRLQRPSPGMAEAHPDADLLTAFAEQSLTGRERDSVMEHLARCGDCREVLALALPASEVVAAKSGVSTPRRWFGWPVLRWGFVAAGILAVTSVGVLQFRQRERKTVATSLIAGNQVADQAVPSSAPAPQVSTPLQAPAPAVTAKPTEMRKKAEARPQSLLTKDKLAATTKAPFAQSQRMHGATSGGVGSGASAGSAFGGPIKGFAPAHRDFSSPPTAMPPATAKQESLPRSTNETVEVTGAAQATQMVEVQAAAPPVTTQTAQNQFHGDVIQNQAADQAQPLNGRTEAVVRAKTSSAPAPAVPGLMKGLPRWTISSAGTLQRSLDGGQTWQDVNLTVDTSTSLNLVGRSMPEMVTVESRSQAKTVTGLETTTDMKSKKKSSGSPTAKSPEAKSADAGPASAAPTIFRALSVSSNAAEVWAGGSGGALYHTVDGGNLWLRVVPSAAGVILTGDVVGIQFADPRNGTIATSNAEIWTTNDDGQTWHKHQ